MERPTQYRVERRKEGGWWIRNQSGRGGRWRHRLAHAEDVARMMTLGFAPPTQKKQVIKDLTTLRLKVYKKSVNKYKIVAYGGKVVVRSFERRYMAEWWLERYQEWVKVQKSKLHLDTLGRQEKQLIDKLEHLWLISDENMDYQGRVRHILSLLRAGVA